MPEHEPRRLHSFEQLGLVGAGLGEEGAHVGDRGGVDVERARQLEVDGEVVELGDVVRVERGAAGGDRALDHVVVGRLVGVRGPALAVTADPRGVEPAQPFQGRARLGPEQGVVAAEEVGAHALGAGIGEHRLERGQVAVDVVEEAEWNGSALIPSTV